MALVQMTDGRKLTTAQYIQYLKDTGHYHPIHGDQPNEEWRQELKESTVCPEES